MTMDLILVKIIIALIFAIPLKITDGLGPQFKERKNIQNTKSKNASHLYSIECPLKLHRFILFYMVHY